MAGKGQQAEVSPRAQGKEGGGGDGNSKGNLESLEVDKNKEGASSSWPCSAMLSSPLARREQPAAGILKKKHQRKVTTRKVSQELGTVANPNPLPKLEGDDARLLQVDSGVGLGVSDLCVSYGLSCEQEGKCESWGNPWLGSDDAGGS